MIFYHPIYSQLDLPPRHRFPIKKYQQLHNQLLELGLEKFIQQPTKASDKQISQIHDLAYIERFLTGTLTELEIKKMGFPWSNTLVERTLLSVGASMQAAEHALAHGFAANISGGYHHAQVDHGAGFCIFNDHVIAARHLIDKGLAERVVIFDCDVHQGDGTANCAKQFDDIITCSVHCEQNYPRTKAVSDYDFGIEVGCEDEAYLNTVEQALSFVTRLHQPDIILYNAGADIYSGDELGQLNVSLDGVRRRETLILDFCEHNKLPLSVGLGGGYQRNEQRLVDVHKQLFIALVDKLDIMV